MINLLAALAWDPGFRGILTVAVAVTILCGSIFLILATNNGARLGFMLALTGFTGWMFVLASIWSMYGIGYKGPAPSWRVVDTVRGNPSGSKVGLAVNLPNPSDLPDPIKVRDSSAALLKAFPKTLKPPNLGDLMDDPGASALRDKINKKYAPWTILPTSSKYTGDSQSKVAAELGPDGQNVFPNLAADYIVIDSFITGGKQGLGHDGSILHRIWYKATSPFNIFHPPFRAAVQLQAVIPQTTKAGQAPPAPVRDPNAPVYTIILERDHGALRLPSICFTIVCMTIFAILANMLHRRDKLAAAQRAVAGAS